MQIRSNQRKKHNLAILAFAVLLIASLACGGFGLAYEKDLVGKYAVWATDTEEQAAVVEKDSPNGASGVIPAMVFAYGWNDQFIIAKQHPPLGDSSFIVDVAKTHWFIVKVGSGKVYGPLTEQEYSELRQKLGLPDSLVFTEFIEPSNKTTTPTGQAK